MPRSPRRSSSRRQPGRPAVDASPEARDALLDATTRLLARHGAGELTLRRIAEEAGVTPAMVHYYFGTKDGLYDAALERTFARILARVRAVAERFAAADASPSEPLRALLEVLVEAFTAEPWIPPVVVREVLSEGGRFRERFIESYASRMAELLPGLMRREIEAGHLRADLDPRLAFLSFMGMTLLPFVARPVVGRVLGIEYDEAFLQRFAAHTQRLFLEGAQS